MNAADLDELFEYDLWATNRLMDAADKVAKGELTERKGHGVGSVAELMTHQGDAQLRWLDRLEGREARPYDIDRHTTSADLRSHCGDANARIRAWMRGAGDDVLGEDLIYSNARTGATASIRKSHLMMQLVGHGIHHRAEAAELLTAAGAAPEGLDIILFYQQR